MAEKKKVLIAEDNPINQKLIRVLLMQMGYEAVIADNGVEALEKFRNDRFDLVLMDIHMPEMDGIECARHIIELNTENVPVIALTADDSIIINKEYLKKNGLHDYILKPVDKEKIREKLEEYL